MSNPEEANSCVPDTQETYYEGANDSSRDISETQNTALSESQDFHLVDSEGDESMVERMKQTKTEEGDSQKLVEQMDQRQILETLGSEMDNNVITTNDKEDDTITKKKVIENEAIERTKGNVHDELCEPEKKDELLDEDEVIQGTPPDSPFKTVSSIDATSLKRKAKAIDELPTKIPRTLFEKDTTKKRLEEEDRHQSYESDDSYQDLFKNDDKNVIIEETQDPTVEFTQKIPAEHATETTDDNEARKLHTEHVDQQQDEAFSEKCDMKKDENLNVSAKLIDTSANDSIIININSTIENDSRLEDNSLSVETKGDVTSTSIVIADEKSGIGTSDKTESVRDTETISDKNNEVEQSNCIKPIEKTFDNDEEIPSSQAKSRDSVVCLLDTHRATSKKENKSKPQVVQIDDDGEKVVDTSTEMMYDNQIVKTRPELVQIDDSHEDGEKILDSSGKNFEAQSMDKSSYETKSTTDFSYRSMESMKESSLESNKTANIKLVNGSAESKKSETDATLSLDSETFSGCDEQILPTAVIKAINAKKIENSKNNFFTSKDMDNSDVINISDHETFNVEEKNKSDLINNSMAKTVQVERDIGVYVKLKCVMHIDESTKEPVSKELITVQCEPIIIESTGSQSSLADISDNKDSSPGSVNSNPQLYPLNPSRLSIMSSVSSSSSASSAASLAVRLALKSSGHFFPMPVGPAKHAKKSSQDILSTPDKQTIDETYDRLTREWKNHPLLATTILSYANAELSNVTTTTAATTTTLVDTFGNVSNERSMDDHHHLEKNNMHSSTPSDQPMTNIKIDIAATPKSTKKSKAVKRPRNKLARSNTKTQINGTDNISNEPASVTETDTPVKKKSKIESTEDKSLISNVDVLANSSPRNTLDDEVIGKTVFAKWSDNNYYAGTVSDRLKTKYKVDFFDGKSKMLIPEFVILIPKMLREGLSVYAATKANDYGSCGIIIDVHVSDNDDTYYTVETDEGERLRVQIQNIFLSTDQAQVLKEEVESMYKSSLPSTPKALGQVTLDNMIDGKRRSKRIGTPLFSTPKSKSNAGTSSSASKTKVEPSVSGISAKLKKDTVLENESMSSDSNFGSPKIQDKYILWGVQKEIIGTPYEQTVKGPQSRIKSKPRSKKREEDPETIATLGPIPTNSNIFKGMSFILTCALKTLDRHLDTKVTALLGTETEVTETDVETENEDDWEDRPFVRDRLHTQIRAGGGKVYENFEEISKDEYKNTMLITNVPNTTTKSILCLSAGIPVCNHKYIIRCCTEGKKVSAAEHALPNGWSLLKKMYIEKFHTSGSKPLSEVVVIIPTLIYDEQFTTFWQQVCENAGAVVLIAENSESMVKMDFDSNVVVVSNQKCPSWVTDRAVRLQIPVLSTTWVVQCLIEGRLCPKDQHPRYKYNYIPKGDFH